MNKFLKISAPMAALALIGTVANAAPILTLTDSAGDVFSGTTTVISPGVINMVGSIGGWSVNVVTAETYPLLGSLSKPDMDLAFTDTYNGAGSVPGSVLTINFTADGFTGVSAGMFTSIGGTQSGTSTTFQTFAGATPLTSLTPGGTTPYALSGFSSLNNYSGSLSEVITLTASGGTDQTSGDANLTAVPDGGTTLSLLGSAMIGLGLLKRKFMA